MKNISITATELEEILENTPAEHNIMLVGNHGIGKSEILTGYFNRKGMRVTALFLGQMSDPGDLLGLPHKNETSGKTEFMPPYWFPVDGKPIVLFLDELNRARPEILQTVMDLALNRKLAGRALPEGSRIISAVNEGEQYQLTDLDPALVSRFNIYTFRPTPQEWCIWAMKNDVDQRVVSFISENSQWLDGNPDNVEGNYSGLEKTPDRRAWKRVSDVIKGKEQLGVFHTKLVSGIVGPVAAAQFFSKLSSRSIISARQILMDFNEEKTKKAIKGYELHQFSILNDSIFSYLETERIKDGDLAKVSDNLMDYFAFLTKNRKEAAAHFASDFTKGTWKTAVKFISKYCKLLPSLLISYVSSIK